MTLDPPAELVTPVNRAVLAHLAEKSAHSDIAEVLTRAVKPLGDVQIFCPDWHSYRYVVVSTRGVVFGFALGMETVAFRLGDAMKQRALVTGGIAYPACGDDWVAVCHGGQDSDWPAVDTPFWVRQAYIHARQ